MLAHREIAVVKRKTASRTALEIEECPNTTTSKMTLACVMSPVHSSARTAFAPATVSTPALDAFAHGVEHDASDNKRRCFEMTV